MKKQTIAFKQLLCLAICSITMQIPSYASSTFHIKIGVAFSAQNKYDRSTQQILNGIIAAKLLYEKEHRRYKIELINYDFSPHDLASVAIIANRICVDKIPIVIGGEMSEDALMLGKILNTCHAVLISPTATNPSVTENRPFVFRISASDDEVAKKMSLFTHKMFNKENIGVIDDVSLPYPDFLTKSFISSYSKFNSNLILKKVLRENIDYSHEIDEFIKKKVKVVIMLTYDTDLKRFFYQAAERNYFPIYIGSDGWGSNESIAEIMKVYSSYGNRFIGYRNNYWKEDSKDHLNIQFKKFYQARFNKTPNAWNAIGFDSAWVVFTAISNGAAISDSENIRKKISNIKKLKLLTTANFSFEKNNTPIRNLYIYKVTANGSKFILTLKK